MKLKPEDFDWEKYDYLIDGVAPGEEFLDNDDRWRKCAPSVAGGIGLIRIPKPEPLYQLLTPGMVIREGDEFWNRTADKWDDLGFSYAGQKVSHYGLWRRKLPEGTKLP